MQYELDLSDVKVLRTAIRIATNTVARNAEEKMMPSQEAFEFIAVLDALDEHLYETAKNAEEEYPAEQLRIFD